MARLVILLSFLTAGCAYLRPDPAVEVAPDPVIYPPPSAGGRYVPWSSGLAPAELAFIWPFRRASPPPRPLIVD